MNLSMKKIFFLLIACFSIVNLYSQTETVKKNTVDVYIAPGYGNFGGGNEIPFNIGIDYSRRLTERWSLGGGLERMAILSSNKYDISTEQVGDEIVTSATIRKGLFLGWVITSIPIQLKYHFTKTVYFNFGPSLDISNGFSETEFGLGLRAGVGFEHEFKNGILLYLNPYLKADFGSWDVNYFLIAVNLGIGYRF